MYLEQDDFFIDEQGILERVDEYSLYCHYLEYEPQFGVKYNSPVRTEDADDRPSFGMYHAKTRRDVEYMWKDQGKGIHGDIFDLVQRLFNLESRIQARIKIRGDFGLGPGMEGVQKVMMYKPKPSPSFRIRVRSNPFTVQDYAYWAQFNWDKKMLEFYNTTRIGMYWSFIEQMEPKFPRTPGYAYRIWDHYKLYFPFELPDFKFRNDLDERHLEGLPQLKYNSDLLVIAKAMKDVGFLRSIGVEAVAARGEHTMIPDHFMQLFLSKYRYVVTFFDNDGKHKAAQYAKSYNIPGLQIPLELGQKDITDYCKATDPQMAEALTIQLLNDQAGIGTFVRSYLSG